MGATDQGAATILCAWCDEPTPPGNACLACGGDPGGPFGRPSGLATVRARRLEARQAMLAARRGQGGPGLGEEHLAASVDGEGLDHLDADLDDRSRGDLAAEDGRESTGDQPTVTPTDLVEPVTAEDRLRAALELSDRIVDPAAQITDLLGMSPAELAAAAAPPTPTPTVWTLPDEPRRGHGRRYAIALIVGLVAVAVGVAIAVFLDRPASWVTMHGTGFTATFPARPIGSGQGWVATSGGETYAIAWSPATGQKPEAATYAAVVGDAARAHGTLTSVHRSEVAGRPAEDATFVASGQTIDIRAIAESNGVWVLAARRSGGAPGHWAKFVNGFTAPG